MPEIFRFCEENGLDIKLFDISRYDNALSGSGNFADANYVSLGGISAQLEKQYGQPAIVYAVGGYGHAKKSLHHPSWYENRNTRYLASSLLFRGNM